MALDALDHHVVAIQFLIHLYFIFSGPNSYAVHCIALWIKVFMVASHAANHLVNV